MIENYRRLEAAEIMEMDGETLILNQETFAVTKLNEVGGWIWKSLAECSTVEQLAVLMIQEYKVELERACEDLKIFLNRMMDVGLVLRA